MTEWHGWSRGDVALHIGYLPGRKSVCLYVVRGGRLDVLAYFRNEQAAWHALATLDELIVP